MLNCTKYIGLIGYIENNSKFKNVIFIKFEVGIIEVNIIIIFIRLGPSETWDP